MSSDNKLSRRRFLRATGAAAGAAALAGCSDNGGETTTTTDGTTTTTAQYEEQEVYKPGTIAVEATGDYELQMEVQQPFYAALEMLAYSSFAALPEGTLGDIEGYDGDMEYEEFATSAPIGAGPFEFDDWTQGTEASVTAFDDYHGETAKVDGVHWQVLEKDQARYNYAMNRNADLFGIPTSQYSPDKVSIESSDERGRKFGTYGPARNEETLNMVRVPSLVTYWMEFNMEEVPKPVRQAFAYAANQQTIVESVFKNRGIPAYHVTPPSAYPGGAEAYDTHAKNYPYGYNSSNLQKARQVMEEAGFGENNRFSLTLTLYDSDTWESLALILRDQLASAYVDVEIQRTQFSTMLEQARNGKHDMLSAGWLADYPGADNFLANINPPQTDTSKTGPISYMNWSSETGDAAEQATELMESIRNNMAPTEAARQTRQEAYPKVEEANWEDVAAIPLYHPAEDYFWYDTIDYSTVFGGMGISRQKYNTVSMTDQSEDEILDRIMTGTITTMDPVNATDTASGEVIAQVFDGLTAYQNGTTTVTNLLATDYEVSDDNLTYTFNLEESATFHDGSDVTAQDFVYSLERLAASPNSRRSSFLLDTLGVKHDTQTITVQK